MYQVLEWVGLIVVMLTIFVLELISGLFGSYPCQGCMLSDNDEGLPCAERIKCESWLVFMRRDEL